MSYEVDVHREYTLSKSRYLKVSLLFSSLLTLVLISDVLLMLLSKENYTPYLIISIIISVLFSWFAIYFFTNINKDINSRYRYFQGYARGQQSQDEVIYEKLGKDLELINGLYVYPLKVKYLSNLEEPEEKTIYSFSEDLHFKRGDKLSIKTYQRILISAESHK